MSMLMQLLFVCFVGIIKAEENVEIEPPPEENQPNWVLFMVIVIVSSLVATIVGVVALVRKPMVPELPEFQEPNFGPDQQFGSSSWHNNEDQAPCQEYPISTQEESYPMESLQNPQATSHQGAPSQESGIYPALSFEPQTVFPPVTVMTQRM